ncbi:somatostatin receptor type 4 [Danaus plexippus]|uniref:somatostatin receptor type 4 n=1 Tax=Danaus plexippus TaxID=13037 RepID=UPI002AAF2A88|nr:somatostatin receptor type 4 [Danaus plexippus]
MFINRDNYTLDTSTEPPNNANQTDFDIMIVQLVNTVYLYFTPILVVLGTIGNMLSLFVFHGSKLRLQSTSQYLSTLAIADNIFLLQLLPPWLSATGITSLFHRTGFCQFIVYVSYVSCCLSAWLVVAFTVERFVAVVYPLRRNAVCSVNRARQVIVLLSISAIVMNLPVLKFTSPSKDDCNIDREYLDHAARFNLIDTLLSFTLPLGVIIIMNSWIMVGVCRLERARQALMKEEQTGLPSRLRQRRLVGCPQSQQKVTRMLLLVSSVFVILNLPAYTIRILAYAYDINANEVGGRWTALQQLSVMFFHTNFGINFLLYCLSGQNYRRALIQALPWVRRRARRAVAVRFAADPPRGSSVSTSHVSTEATVINMTNLNTNQQRQRDCITRWKFDNTRQRQAMAHARSQAERSELASVTVEGRAQDMELRTVHTI